MTKLTRLLKKFSRKEQEEIDLLISKLVKFNFTGLDIKKLSGHSDIFRLKKGRLRIIYQTEKGKVILLDISKRSENSYKNL